MGGEVITSRGTHLLLSCAGGAGALVLLRGAKVGARALRHLPMVPRVMVVVVVVVVVRPPFGFWVESARYA